MNDKVGYRYAVVGLGVAEALFLIGVSVIVAVGHVVPSELWTIGAVLGGGLLGLLVPSPKGSGKAKAAASAAVAHSAAANAARAAAAREDGDVQQAAAEAAQSVADRSVATRAIGSSRSNPTSAAVTLAGTHAAAAASLAQQAKDELARAQGRADEQANAASDLKASKLQAKSRVYQAAAEAAGSPQTQRDALAAANAAPTGPPTFGAIVSKLIVPLIVFAAALGFGIVLTSGVWIHPSRGYMAEAVNTGNALLALAAATGGAFVGIFAPSPAEAKSTTS